jgi:hypothetical protein
MIHHAVLAELGLQPLGDAEDAAERTDVFAHEQDLRVVGQRLAQAGREGLGHRHGLDRGGGRL